MKSGGLIAIFVIVVAVVGGLIWYDAKDVQNIEPEMVQITTKKTTIEKNGEEVVTRKKIDVMADDDIEMDTSDVIEEDIDVANFDNIDNIIMDESVKF